MVPPGDRKYFFSIAGQQYCARNHNIVKIKKLQDIMKRQENTRKSPEKTAKDRQAYKGRAEAGHKPENAGEVDLDFEDVTDLL